MTIFEVADEARRSSTSPPSVFCSVRESTLLGQSCSSGSHLSNPQEVSEILLQILHQVSFGHVFSKANPTIRPSDKDPSLCHLNVIARMSITARIPEDVTQ
jgi:hypothetical protein